MFLNSLHYCLLNKPICLRCPAFENGSDFLAVPWESRAELQQETKNLLPFSLICSTFSSFSVAALPTALLSLSLNFCHLYAVTRLVGFLSMYFYFTLVKATVLMSTLGNHMHPSRKTIF